MHFTITTMNTGKATSGGPANPTSPNRCSGNPLRLIWAVPHAARPKVVKQTHLAEQTPSVLQRTTLAHPPKYNTTQRTTLQLSNRTCAATRASCAGGHARFMTSRWALEYLRAIDASHYSDFDCNRKFILIKRGASAGSRRRLRCAWG